MGKGFKNKVSVMRNVLAGFFCMAALFVLAPAMDVLAAEGTISASSANIRSSADTGSTVVASLLHNNKITILDEVTGTDGKVWYKIQVDADTIGYVRSDLVKKSGASNDNGNAGTDTNTGSVSVSTEGVNVVEPVSGSTNQGNVRVRSDASTSSDVVKTINDDVVFTVTGTKENGSATWYLVNFLVNGSEVKGYIRSDLVTLEGELTAPTETPEAPVETPAEGEGETPSNDAPAYEVAAAGETWYLIDNVGGKKYPIAKMMEQWEDNATRLSVAQKKVSQQKGTIIILVILLAIILMGIAFMVFKIKDMMDDGSLEIGNVNKRPAGQRPSANGGARASGKPAGQRPSGTRPAQTRPAQTRPAGSTATAQSGTQVKPASVRPAQTRPVGQRPAGVSQTVSEPKPAREVFAPKPVSEEQLAEESKKAVEQLEKRMNEQSSQKRQSKNFMEEDDEFAFEFLNWEDDEK